MKIEIKNVTKRYGKQYALKGFSVTLEDGVYGLLGPNGAGKTTLINIILGILPADTGAIFLDGTNVNAMKRSYFDLVGYLPQYPEFYKHYTCREFLDYMCVIKNINKKIAKERIDELLQMVNLKDAESKRIGAFSGGMRQRLGIAQAILNDPKILILDEPTAGLDPKERIRFRNIISKLSKNRIVILATHIVTDVEFIAKEVMIMNKGQLLQKGTLQQLTEPIMSKVWKMEVDEETSNHLLEKYSVGNIVPTEIGYQLKIVSDTKPDENAQNIAPALEDVFMYYFGKEDKEG